MSNVGYATLQIIPSARGFQSALDGQVGGPMRSVGTRGGQQMGGAMKGGLLGSVKGVAGPLVAAMGLAKVGAFLKDAIGAASDLNETVSKTNVIFGKQGAAALQKFAANAATAYGQTKQQALDAAATFGVFGKSAGLSGVKLAGFSTKMTALASDLASFHNTSPQQAIEAIGSAFRGETEPMRAYGVLLNDASMRQEALRLGLIKTTNSALTPQQKVLAAQALIMRQTKDAQGDFARTSGGLANQQRILSAQWADAKTKIGGIFLPMVTSAVRLLNSGLGPAMKGAGLAWKAFQDGLAGKSGGKGPLGFITKLGNDVRTFGNVVSPVFKQVVAGVREFFSGFGSGGGMESFTSGLANIKAQIQAGFLPVVQNLAATFTTKVLPALQQVGGFIQTNVFPIISQLWQIIQNQVVPVLVMVYSYLYGQLYPAIIAIVIAVGQRLAPVFKAVAQVWQTSILPSLQQLLTKFREWWPTIQKVISMIVQMDGRLLKFAASILAFVLPPLIKFAGFLLKYLVGNLIRTISVVVRVIGWIAALGSAFLGAIGKVAAFASAVKSKVGQVVGFVRGIPGRVKGALGNLGGLLVGAGKAVLEGFLNGLKSSFESVKSFVGGIASWISNNKGPIEYDRRLLVPHGKAIMAGFVKGLSGGFKAVKREIGDVNAFLRKSGKSAVARALRDEEKRLLALAKRRDVIAARLTKAKAALDQAIKAKDLGNQTRDNLLGMGNVTQGAGDFKGMVSNLKDTIAQSGKFASVIARLKKAGLNAAMIEQIIQAGPVAGTEAGLAILAEGKKGVGELNGLQVKLSKSASSVGKAAYKALGGVGVQAAQGLVNGLASQQKKIESQMSKLASAMIKAIKRALGIHSPSRVFADLGQNVPAGMALGIKRGSHKVTRAVSGMTAIPEAKSGAGAGSGAGPLIGSLTLQASGNTRDDLEEAMFQVRRINRGGVYA